MPTREEVLKTETFKGDVDDLDVRIFYTLTKAKGLEMHRVAKALSGLIAYLADQRQLGEEEIDNLLLDCID
jgi:hypothetical protein